MENETSAGPGRQRIGIISDTHGLLRPEAVDALRGSSLILHAGDIGNPGILSELERIAPVIAVRGNNDVEEWASGIAEREVVHIDGVQVHMLHDVKEMDGDPSRAGHRVVVSGHSHKPSIDERDGVIFLNPGSAGPRRFKLPVSVAVLDIVNASVEARIIELSVPAGTRKSRSRT